jgi:hypothetical protein
LRNPKTTHAVANPTHNHTNDKAEIRLGRPQSVTLTHQGRATDCFSSIKSSPGGQARPALVENGHGIEHTTKSIHFNHGGVLRRIDTKINKAVRTAPARTLTKKDSA